MKLILENWRKLLEGDVINFPSKPTASEDDIKKIISLEDDIGNLLASIYGNQSEIPIDVIEIMDSLVDAVEESLKK
jgi:hypothetical protein